MFIYLRGAVFHTNRRSHICPEDSCWSLSTLVRKQMQTVKLMLQNPHTIFYIEYYYLKSQSDICVFLVTCVV